MDAQSPPQPADSGTSPLLDLPPELRNMIYEFCICSADTPEIADGRVINPAPELIRVSRQVRSEALAVFIKYGKKHAIDFRATVMNFDFSPVAQALAYISSPTHERILNIDLVFNYHFDQQDLEELAWWMKFCGRSQVMRRCKRVYAAVFTEERYVRTVAVMYMGYELGRRARGVEDGGDREMIFTAIKDAASPGAPWRNGR